MPRLEPRLDNSDDVSLDAARTARGGHIPETKIYIPNYQGVNQLLTESGGNAAIRFGEALAKQSTKAVDEYRAVNNRIEAANSMINIRASTDKDAKKFLEENVSGEGYMEFTTSKYREYTQEAMKSASDPDVQEMIRLHSIQGLNDVSNSAMKDESAIKTGYMLSQAEDGKSAILAQLRRDPDLVESLSTEYDSLVQTMQKFSPKEYGQYRKKSKEEFGIAYVRGRIDKDPYQALEMLKGGSLEKELPYQLIDSLTVEAEREVHHREAEANRAEVLHDKIRRQLMLERITDIKYAAAFGTDNPDRMIEESYTDGTFTENEKKEAELWLYEHNKASTKKEEAVRVLDDCVENNVPAPLTISETAKSDHFYNYIESVNQRREGEQKKPMSLSEIVEYAKSHSVVYDGNISRLKTSVATNIMSEKNPAKIMDASIAITGNEDVRAIKGLDKNLHYFANFAVSYFSATKDLSSLVDFRDRFFTPVEVSKAEYRNSEWNNSKYATNKSEEMGAFLKKSGFATDKGWFSDSVPETIKKKLSDDTYQVMEHMYKKTGSFAIAESVASDILSHSFAVTDINGREERLYNPPRRENTGLPNFAVHNLVSARGQELIEEIEKAGSAYKGYIPVKKLYDLVEKKSLKEYYEIPAPVKDRKISAFIGGKWQERILRIEANPRNGTTYSYYILIDEGDSRSKEYLVNPKSGERAIIDFSSIKVVR